jgi:DNA primase
LEHGAAALHELVDRQAVDALEHAFNVHTRGVDLRRDVHAASEALERLLGVIARAPRLTAGTSGETRLREQKTLQRIAAEFGVPEEEVRRRLIELRRRRGSSPSVVPPTRKPNVDRAAPGPDESEYLGEDEAIDVESPEGTSPRSIPVWDRELLELLVVHPELSTAAGDAIAAEQISHPACRRIYETLCRLTATGEPVGFDRLSLEFDQPAMQGLLVDLDETGRAKGEVIADPEALLKELIATFERQEAQRRDPARIAQLREGSLDDEQQRALLAEMLQQARARHGISDPTDG